MTTRVVAPASEIAEIAKQRDPYYNQYLQLLTSTAQTGLQQSTEQIQQQTSQNIAQAYSSYLSQQRALAENPTISTGDVARLSSQGQSAYSTAYQAYKAKEAQDIYSTALDYQEQLESSISGLNKQYGEYGSKIRQVEEALLEYMPSAVNKYYAEQVSSGKMTQEEANAILSDENLYNKSDLSKEYLIALSGLNEQGESFYTTLLRDNPDLADWAIQNRELFERTALGDYYTNTADVSGSRTMLDKIVSTQFDNWEKDIASQKGVEKSDKGIYYRNLSSESENKTFSEKELSDFLSIGADENAWKELSSGDMVPLKDDWRFKNSNYYILKLGDDKYKLVEAIENPNNLEYSRKLNAAVKRLSKKQQTNKELERMPTLR